MGALFDIIRQLVSEEKYLIGQHAAERLEERGIMEWQAVAGLDDGGVGVGEAERYTEPDRRGA
jgi:hypothetical protein